MSAMSDSFMSILGMKKAKACPDCGSPMMNGECPECGYGSEEDGMESESEGIETSALLELRDDLQRVVSKLGELIKNAD